MTTPEGRIPRINEIAPDFEANSTQGPIKLSNFRGKWVVLFSHPADFTPVCTTEFIGFARYHETFAQLNAQLIGLSEAARTKFTAPQHLRGRALSGTTWKVACVDS